MTDFIISKNNILFITITNIEVASRLANKFKAEFKTEINFNIKLRESFPNVFNAYLTGI